MCAREVSTPVRRERENQYSNATTRASGVKERALKRKGLKRREKKKTPSHLFLVLGAFSLIASAGANENSHTNE
jgi:hypothetical protein